MPKHPLELLHSDAKLDARIVDVLENAPSYDIPLNFAARMVSEAAKVSVPTVPVELKQSHYGRSAAIVSMFVLLILIWRLAHHASFNSISWSIAESLLCLQFGVIAVWLTLRDIRIALGSLLPNGR